MRSNAQNAYDSSSKAGELKIKVALLLSFLKKLFKIQNLQIDERRYFKILLSMKEVRSSISSRWRTEIWGLNKALQSDEEQSINERIDNRKNNFFRLQNLEEKSNLWRDFLLKT